MLQLVTPLIWLLLKDIQEIHKMESATKVLEHTFMYWFSGNFPQSNAGITPLVLNYIKIFYKAKHTKTLIMKFILL